MVINRDTEIKNCVDIALRQDFNNKILKDIYEENYIKFLIVDMNEKHIYNTANIEKEIDNGSCGRWNLLYNMLKGSYTEDNTHYGNYQSYKYEFIPDIEIEYNLKTYEEIFLIKHKCSYVNEIKTRIIPIQEDSRLTNN